MNAPPKDSDIEVRAITAAETLPLRHAILRPGRPLESARFPGDDDAGVIHLGAYRQGKLLAVSSLYPVELPERPGISTFQLRGMATAPEARGTGLGTMLILAGVAYAREKSVELLWCNARVSAVEFYRRLNFQVVGGEFQISDVGPHLRMVRVLVEASPPG